MSQNYCPPRSQQCKSKKKKLNSSSNSNRSSHSSIQIITIHDDVAAAFTPISLNDTSSKATTTTTHFIDLSSSDDDDDDDDDLRVLRFIPTKTHFGKRTRNNNNTFEPGQSSSTTTPPPSPFVCDICADDKPGYESFPIENCAHVFCTDCVVNYIDSKLQQNITTIRCPVPNCQGLLEQDYCRPILPDLMFDRWGQAMCDAVILGSERFYCPYKDCSALLIDDGEERVTQSQCPHCRRMFCADCKVAWHEGMDCAAFKVLGADERGNEDIMLRNLAESQKWKRCPSCKFYVEKSYGCSYMKCRCGFAFCYNCGVQALVHTGACRSCRK